MEVGERNEFHVLVQGFGSEGVAAEDDVWVIYSKEKKMEIGI